MTALYSVLHFLVDGVCAWAMLGPLAGGMESYLLYNFCAFVLQLPLGAYAASVHWTDPYVPAANITTETRRKHNV